MNILLTFNEKFAPHAATTISSIIENTKESISFSILHFEGELLKSTISKFTSFYSEKVKSIEFYSVGYEFKDKLVDCNFPNYLSVNAFLRLFSPCILKNDDEILYLDSDIIVLGDILELMKLRNKYFAVNAIAEHYPSDKINILKSKKKRSIDEDKSLEIYEKELVIKNNLGMSPNSPYFNTGVMILNLNLWRENKILDTIFEYIKMQPNLPCGDQDALNAILDGNFAILPPEWNVFGYTQLLNSYTSSYTEKELLNIKNSPKIIHFVARCKPWSYMYLDTDIKKKYWYYRGLTPWPKKQEEDKSFRNVIYKNIKCIVKQILKM